MAAVAPTFVVTNIDTLPATRVTVTRIATPVSSIVLQTTTTKTSTKPTSTVVQSSSSSTKTTSTKTTSTTSSTTSTSINPTFTAKDPILDGIRNQSMLADIRGIYDLPTKDQVIRNATLNATDIQGDILVGMKKKLELFYFFHINEPKSFKKKFHTYVVPRVTSTLDLLSVSSQPVVCLNVAFSQTGLYTLGINDNLFDSPFSNGQAADANNLGDPGFKYWLNAFIGTKIHGVFLIASDDMININAMVNWLEALFGSDITKMHELQGNIRPPPYDGHEMFGYLDGVSQPAVAGFNINPVPGQQLINAGVILVGEVGDTLQSVRPAWAKDGSFLVFRQLQQFVPEFDQFLRDWAPPAPASMPGMTLAQRADLLGARMMGRWKSGAPVDLTPLVDNPALGANPNANNNFDYSHTGFNLATDQSHCPFAAHTRKTRPRADQNTPLNAIMRAGIPYGPEPTQQEYATNTSSQDPDMERGLAFVSYQSQIDRGYRFIQMKWANDVNFAPGKTPQPGFDMIFGNSNGGTIWMSGADVDHPNDIIKAWQFWVLARGGEYFFSPSISALKNVISV